MLPYKVYDSLSRRVAHRLLVNGQDLVSREKLSKRGAVCRCDATQSQCTGQNIYIQLKGTLLLIHHKIHCSPCILYLALLHTHTQTNQQRRSVQWQASGCPQWSRSLESGGAGWWPVELRQDSGYHCPYHLGSLTLQSCRLQRHKCLNKHTCLYGQKIFTCIY